MHYQLRLNPQEDDTHCTHPPRSGNAVLLMHETNQVNQCDHLDEGRKSQDKPIGVAGCHLQSNGISECMK